VLHERFGALSYEVFRDMAGDSTLSVHERSGFPDEYRAGAELLIVADIETKLPALLGTGAVVVDIGCGANPLSDLLRRRCHERKHSLLLVDSAEVLALHEPGDDVKLIAGRFPDVPLLMRDYVERCDAVLAYSVVQYAPNIFAFIDAALALLRPGGRLLIGDIPNASMRRRFLASAEGRAYHRVYTGRDEDPPITWPYRPNGEIDDSVILALLARARDAGFHAWSLPQEVSLPMANRREDLVFVRP
jgi:SAM-dependent methyltransferase